MCRARKGAGTWHTDRYTGSWTERSGYITQNTHVVMHKLWPSSLYCFAALHPAQPCYSAVKGQGMTGPCELRCDGLRIRLAQHSQTSVSALLVKSVTAFVAVTATAATDTTLSTKNVRRRRLRCSTRCSRKAASLSISVGSLAGAVSSRSHRRAGGGVAGSRRSTAPAGCPGRSRPGATPSLYRFEG